jgi:hypothetical protein
MALSCEALTTFVGSVTPSSCMTEPGAEAGASYVIAVSAEPARMAAGVIERRVGATVYVSPVMVAVDAVWLFAKLGSVCDGANLDCHRCSTSRKLTYDQADSRRRSIRQYTKIAGYVGRRP